MRALLVPLAVMLALPFAFARASYVQPADVQAGYCARQVVSYTAFMPHAVQLRLADAGFPITVTAVPYKHLQGRAWACNWPDGGSGLYPPRVGLLSLVFRRDLLAVTSPGCYSDAGALCPVVDDGTDDGGDNVDPLQEDAFECACAATAACLLADGGAAPFGLTLQPGVFQPGAACRGKACGELWRLLPDGGRQDSFPAACPVP